MEENRMKASEDNVTEEEFTREESKNQLLTKENDIISGMLKAAGFGEEVTRKISIVRNGQEVISFHIRPLEDYEYNSCREKYTRYSRNKQLGLKLPEKTDNVRYRSLLIYTATVEADREKLWDNKNVWKALGENGKPIVTAIDVIDACLFAGEKNGVVEAIDELSGYDQELEETVKN